MSCNKPYKCCVSNNVTLLNETLWLILCRSNLYLSVSEDLVLNFHSFILTCMRFIHDKKYFNTVNRTVEDLGIQAFTEQSYGKI